MLHLVLVEDAFCGPRRLERLSEQDLIAQHIGDWLRELQAQAICSVHYQSLPWRTTLYGLVSLDSYSQCMLRCITFGNLSTSCDAAMTLLSTGRSASHTRRI
jgi:hypothetical protein